MAKGIWIAGLGLLALAAAANAKPLPKGSVDEAGLDALLRGLGADSAISRPVAAHRSAPIPLYAPQPEEKHGSLDPFLAGAFGIMPFSSGFYITDQPAKGYVFTGIDVLLSLGIYTSRYTKSGDPANALAYYVLMVANNVLDAWLSVKETQRTPAPRVTFVPGGGVQYALQWTF